MNINDIIDHIERGLKQPLWENWYISGRIGTGAFSKVYRIEARRNSRTDYAAMKIEPIVAIDEYFTDEREKRDFLDKKKSSVENESTIMYNLKDCPNIVQYEDENIQELIIDGRFEGYFFLIKMELLSCVHDLIKGGRMDFTEVNILKLAKHIGNGIKAAHDIGIIHRDIKPSNFFLSEKGVYKLGDFNISKQSDSARSFAGTNRYIAPEIYRAKSDIDECYTNQADIYSFGICLYQFMNGMKFPFEDTLKDPDSALNMRMNGDRLPFPKNASAEFGNIILKACAYDTKDRYRSMDEMLSDLNGINAVSSKPAPKPVTAVPDTDKTVYAESGDTGHDDLNKTVYAGSGAIGHNDPNKTVYAGSGGAVYNKPDGAVYAVENYVNQYKNPVIAKQPQANNIPVWNNNDKRRNNLPGKPEKRISFKSKILIFLISVIITILIFFFIGVIVGDQENKSSVKSTNNSSDKHVESIVVISATELESNMLTEPDGYTIIPKMYSDIFEGDLVLVNKENRYRFPESAEDNLIKINGNCSSIYQSMFPDSKLSQNTIEALNNMMDDFYKEKGIKDMMDDIYKEKGVKGCIIFANFESKEKLDKNYREGHSKFPAGYSDFHTGLSFELLVMEQGSLIPYTPEGNYSWIMENCAKYGFILRYPEGKENITGTGGSDVFRYVGIPHAVCMDENNFCLEEYIDYVKKFTFDSEHFMVNAPDKSYEIYYVPAESSGATNVPIPDDKPYTISGNNVDGFIVTVELS